MSPSRQRIGLDLDNTLVCYDGVFAKLAADRGLDCAPGASAKRALREALHRQPGGECLWTELQGEAYGPAMLEAAPYPGVRDALEAWRRAGHEMVIVSHKTRFAALGPAHDFHVFARQWVSRWLGDLGLPVFLELTRWTKLRRIESERCDVFVDDLVDFLQEPTFPAATRRIWFSAGAKAAKELPADIVRAPSWTEVATLATSATGDATPAAAAPAVAASSGRRRRGAFTGDPAALFGTMVQQHLGSRLEHWTPLPGGLNNLGARLRLADGRTVVGKIYKRSPADPRDRLQQETRFLRALEQANIGRVPRVLAIDETNGAALLSLVPGERLADHAPAPDGAWAQCNEFITELQRVAALCEARELPLASEAALTLQDHLAWVQEKRDRWLGLARAGQLSPDLAREVLEELEPAYDRLAREAIAHPEFTKRIDRQQLILSPSDFGLHNALADADGRLSFVDFEYAGWDDPAKTDADFALQPRHGAGRPDRLTALDAQIDRGSSRVRLLRALQELKWRYVVLAARHAGAGTPVPATVSP